MWHLPINESNVKIHPTIMGCGHMQMHGLSNIFMYDTNYQEFKKLFTEKILPQLLKNGGFDNLPCKTFLYVSGERLYRTNEIYQKNLADFGFKEIARYPNAAHPGTGDIQILFILILP